MKEYGGVDVKIHVFLTSILAGGEWSASRPCSFTVRKEAPVPIREETDWAPEPCWTTWRKFLTLPGLKLRPLGRPARNQSLYLLRYHGSVSYI
jgi:hypothetical protein